jgi:hypothetical protein
MALATEVVRTGEQLGNRETLMYGRFTRLYEALEQGQLGTLERELPLAAELADDLRQPLFQSRASFPRAALARALQEQIHARATAERESPAGGAPPSRPPFLRGGRY